LSSLDIPRAEEIRIDGGVLLFALALSIAAGLVFGLVPALQASRPRLSDSLKESGRGQAGSSAGLLRRGLVVAEVSLAVLPLVGALLLLKSFSKLTDVDPGFEPGGALTAQIDLPQAKYTEAEQRAGFYDRLTERLASLPGVDKVGAVTPMPLTGRGFVLTFYVEGEPIPEPNKEAHSNIRVVNDDYFDAMQIPLRRGRFFNRADAFEAPNVAVINESCLTRFFPDQDPLGQRITFDDPEDEDVTWMTIVGVVGDVHHESLAEATDPEIYWSYAQRPMDSTTLVLRTAGPTATLTAPLRAAISEIDSELPIYRVRALQDIVDLSVAQPRFTSLLWGLFAGLALLLAVIGVYSVLSYTVSQKRREIGVRLALGAERFEILQMILRGGMTLVLIGLAAGLLAAFLASNLLRTMVYSISPNDVSSFALAAFVLASVGVLACVIPALRATRVDPVVVLRDE